MDPVEKKGGEGSIPVFHPVRDGKANAAERAAAIQTDITMLAHENFCFIFATDADRDDFPASFLAVTSAHKTLSAVRAGMSIRRKKSVFTERLPTPAET